jgi:hypothetical protein
MDLIMQPLLWAQVQAGGANPNSLAQLAFRRWCAGLTLSSPQIIPGWHGYWAFLAGLGALILVAVLVQGPVAVIRQLFDLPGHLRLVREATQRVRRASRMVAVAIAFTVIAWTGSQAMVYNVESGRTDLLLLTRFRGLGELAVEQGMLTAVTPLRDVAGLGDNLPLLIIATIAVFRASIEPHGPGHPKGMGGAGQPMRPRAGWTTMVWGMSALYILYRIVARAAGSPELPLGGCLIVEAVLVPLAMVIVDGFLLAWILAELRTAGAAAGAGAEDRFDPFSAIALLPGAALACAAALPARYVATFVFLASAHLPTSIYATGLGQYVRWQLGWGLTDLQAAGLVGVGIVGVVAWSRGRLGEAISGYRRLLAAEAGHLIVALAMAGAAAMTLSAAAYAVVLLLPVQTWVLGAADSYAHFVTLPVGLWTLAALIELSQRSLPIAALARPTARSTHSESLPEPGRLAHRDTRPPVGAPTP